MNQVEVAGCNSHFRQNGNWIDDREKNFGHY